MEAALVLPLVVAVAVTCIAALSVVATQLRCLDAAGEAARMYGRGDAAAAAAVVTALAGPATLDVGSDGELVRAVVTIRPLGGFLPGLRVTATGFAVRESSAAGRG